MSGNTIWDEGTRQYLLHILPQATYHGPAEIRGSPSAIRRLGEALITASGCRQTEGVNIRMMASDGECYVVVIRAMSDKQMDAGPLPYAQLGHSWEFERCWDCPKSKIDSAE